MVKHPPDVLITTPESLYLMLTSQARAIFEGTETVILDEIHAVAQTKRGAHLAITLERLVEQAGPRRPARRPVRHAEPARGGRAVHGRARSARATVVDTGVRKPLDLKIHVPVESMVEPENDGPGARPVRRARRRPASRSGRRSTPSCSSSSRSTARTLIFVNNRRAAERLALRLNELAEEPIARAHHGSLAREERLIVEEQLKAGELPCLVATSSARARHRHGRGGPRAAGRVAEVGHRRPAADRPRRPQRRRHVARAASSRSSAPTCSSARSSRSACARARSRRRSSRSNPLDVLAQQIVAMAATDEDDAAARRPAGGDARAHLHVRGALAPAARERPRHARRPLPERGVRRAAAAHRVGPRERHDPRPQGLARAGDHQRGHDPRPRPVLASTSRTAAASASSTRRWSTRPAPGQVFLLGASTWRIEEITRDRVIVTPAPGVPGAIPFWKGDGLGRPRELGEAIGAFARSAVDQDPQHAGRGLRPRREGREQPRRVPARAAGGHAGHPERPHDRGRALPRRDRRLARVRAEPVRRAACTPPGASRCPPASARSTAWSRTRSGPTTASSSTCPTPTSRRARS